MTRQVWEALSLIVCVINYVSFSQEAADPLAETFLCTKTSIDKLYSCSSAQPNFSKGLPTNVISISLFPSLFFFKETKYINTCCVNFFFFILYLNLYWLIWVPYLSTEFMVSLSKSTKRKKKCTKCKVNLRRIVIFSLTHTEFQCRGLFINSLYALQESFRILSIRVMPAFVDIFLSNF